jgi:Ca2+-binding EF-hand superfamily protein
MKKLHCIIATIALTSASLLTAQTTDDSTPRGPRHGGPHGPGGPHGRGGHPIARALDTDKNGEISAAEINAAPASLAALDKNADGSITADEFRPVRPAGAPTPPAKAPKRGEGRTRPVDPFMLALDANTDGALSAAEVGNAVASLKVLDANSDGILTRDELRPLPPAGK